MLAYQLVEWQHPPVLHDVPVPDPGPGEVLVRVGAAGACHSDLHVMEFPAGAVPWQPPFTLGHENAGWVAATGAGVTGWAEGDPVAVYGPWGCGRCKPCRLSAENLCEHAAEIGAAGGGLGRHGGMAEFLLVPDARLLVPLGDLDPIAAAPLTDAGLTPYHAIKQALSLSLLGPDATAVVIGVGGLGHLALQILRALTAARVVALDVSDEKLARARDLGADDTLTSGPDAVAAVHELTGGVGADVVFDIVGIESTMQLAAGMVRTGGHLAFVGLGGGLLPIGFGAVPSETTMVVPYWGTQAELIEVLALGASGRITPHIERFALGRVDEAYRRMRAGTLDGRAVITPDAFLT
jgi:propanol-preferring alcohol dehydrogenase